MFQKCWTIEPFCSNFSSRFFSNEEIGNINVTPARLQNSAIIMLRSSQQLIYFKNLLKKKLKSILFLKLCMNICALSHFSSVTFSYRSVVSNSLRPMDGSMPSLPARSQREELRPWQRSWGRRLGIRKGVIKPQVIPCSWASNPKTRVCFMLSPTPLNLRGALLHNHFSQRKSKRGAPRQ